MRKRKTRCESQGDPGWPWPSVVAFFMTIFFPSMVERAKGKAAKPDEIEINGKRYREVK